MAPLTWREVSAPSFSDSNALRQMAANLMARTGSDLSDAFGDFERSQSQGASSALAMKALQFQDPQAFKTALESGSFFNGVNARNITPEALNFVAGYRGNLQNADMRSAQLTGENINNQSRQLNLQQGQTNFARNNAEYAARGPAGELLAQAETDMLSGDPVRADAARKRLAENNKLLIDAGYTPQQVQEVINRTPASVQAGYADTNARLAQCDALAGRERGATVREMIQGLPNQYASAGEAANAIRARTDLEPRLKNELLAELEKSGANYWGQMDPASAALAAAARPITGNNTSPALIQSESGGNFGAKNNVPGSGGTGHFGRLQFSRGRLDEAKNAGVIPKDMTPEQFLKDPNAQLRTENWHFSDIDRYAAQNGLDRYVGQQIGGVTITQQGMRNVAHLGGKDGLRRFLTTGGTYNPADANGTRLSDYLAKGAGETAVPGSGNFGPRVGAVPSDSGSTSLPSLTPTTPIDIAPVNTQIISADGQYQVVPTEKDGKTLSPEEARREFIDGNLESLGSANSRSEANSIAENLLANAANAELNPDTTQGDNAAAAALTQSAQPQRTAGEITTGANTLADTAQVDRMFNPSAPLDQMLATMDDATRGQTIAQVVQRLNSSEGVLKGVPEAALTESIREIQEKYKVSPAVAGALAEQNLEARDLRGLGYYLTGGLFGAGDDWGKATQGGVRAPRINMEGVQRSVDSIIERTGSSNISQGVARIQANRASVGVGQNAQQITQALGTIEARIASIQQQMALNPQFADRGQAQLQQLLQQRNELYALLQQVNAQGGATTYTRGQQSN